MFLRDMVRDPLTDLLVDPAWAEPPLMRPATNIIDGVALIRPAPFLDRIGETIFVGNIVPITGEIRPLCSKYECGIPVIAVITNALDLLTEDGQTILTEDGQPIRLESADAILTEGGEQITTEDGEIIVNE